MSVEGEGGFKYRHRDIIKKLYLFERVGLKGISLGLIGVLLIGVLLVDSGLDDLKLRKSSSL